MCATLMNDPCSDGRTLSLFNRDTSGQGRFCTIFRSYSRGAQVRISEPQLCIHPTQTLGHVSLFGVHPTGHPACV